MELTGIREIAAHQNEVGKTQIEERIFNIRGRQVMIDRDLALLYGVETKRLNEQVKRNIERFPEDFMFQLTLEECSRSQFATLNIKIMRTFTKIRKSVHQDSNLLNRVELIEYNQSDMRKLLLETTNKVDSIFQSMQSADKSPVQGIFFDGQIYDAYTFVADLGRKAARRIVLIDNYIDDTVLTMLSKRADAVYLVGASIKDLGKKWFGFTLMENTEAEELIGKIELH